MILIFLLHYIYDYFKTNLTTPKVKDLVNKPQMQYEEIIETIKENKKIEKKEILEKKKEDQNSMKNELKKYMNELNETDTIPISMTNDQIYQSF